MSFQDFMYTKHFGKIYQPYAGFLALIQEVIDFGLVSNPDFGRFFVPLTNRDLILIYGTKKAFLAISESSHSHYPLRLGDKWENFFKIPEDNFSEGFNSSPDPVEFSNLNSFFEEKYQFKNPLVIVFPRIVFSAHQPSEDFSVKLS